MDLFSTKIFSIFPHQFLWTLSGGYYSRWLGGVNRVLVPFARAGRELSLLYAAFEHTPPSSLVYVEQCFWERVLEVRVWVPGFNRGYRAIIYYSLQDWWLAPKKTLPKVRKLRRRLLRRCFPCDTLVALVAKRVSRGSLKILRGNNIMFFNSFDELVKSLREYFGRRLSRLLQSLRGKRLFGSLALATYWLQRVCEELGARVPRLFKSMEEALYAALDGIPPPETLVCEGL